MDAEDTVIDECYIFIECALKEYEGVLIHSVKGQSRACAILTAYIMRKYRWTLLKSLEFLNYRIPDIEIRATFINQLAAYENRLIVRKLEPKTSTWNEVFDKDTNQFENEELMLRNTYLNSQMGPIANFDVEEYQKNTKIKWADEEGFSIVEKEYENLQSINYNTGSQGSKRGASRNLKKKLFNNRISENVSESEISIDSSMEDTFATIEAYNMKIINNVDIDKFSSPNILDLFELSPRAQHIPELNPSMLMPSHNKMNTLKKTSNFENNSKLNKNCEKIYNEELYNERSIVEFSRELNDELLKVRKNIGIKMEPHKGELAESIYIPERIEEESLILKRNNKDESDNATRVISQNINVEENII